MVLAVICVASGWEWTTAVVEIVHALSGVLQSMNCMSDSWSSSRVRLREHESGERTTRACFLGDGLVELAALLKSSGLARVNTLLYDYKNFFVKKRNLKL